MLGQRGNTALTWWQVCSRLTSCHRSAPRLRWDGITWSRLGLESRESRRGCKHWHGLWGSREEDDTLLGVWVAFIDAQTSAELDTVITSVTGKWEMKFVSKQAVFSGAIMTTNTTTISNSITSFCFKLRGKKNALNACYLCKAPVRQVTNQFQRLCIGRMFYRVHLFHGKTAVEIKPRCFRSKHWCLKNGGFLFPGSTLIFPCPPLTFQRLFSPQVVLASSLIGLNLVVAHHMTETNALMCVELSRETDENPNFFQNKTSFRLR